MAARSLLFQLPRFIVPSRLGAFYRRPSPSTGLQRKLSAATSHKVAAASAHGQGGAIVATSLPLEVYTAAELLAVKRKGPSKPRRPGDPEENQSGKDKLHGVPDQKAKEGQQGTRNNYAASS